MAEDNLEERLEQKAMEWLSAWTRIEKSDTPPFRLKMDKKAVALDANVDWILGRSADQALLMDPASGETWLRPLDNPYCWTPDGSAIIYPSASGAVDFPGG